MRTRLPSPGSGFRICGARGLGAALLFILTLVNAPVLAANDDVSPAQIEALKERIEDIDDWLQDAREDRSDLEEQLVSTEQTISRLTRERRDLRRQIGNQRTRLAQLGEKEQELTASLARQRDSLKQQIRAAWMAGDTPAIKVLLNEIDPQNVARTMTYYEYLSADTVRRLEVFNASLQALKTTREEVNRTQTELARLERDVASRQQQLETRKAERQQTLARLRTEISQRQNEREQLESDRVRLEKLLKEVEAAIANIPAPNESQPFRSLRAKLPWPVAAGRVSRNFGEQLAQGRLRHNGLLLITDAETEVTAVHYGRVVFANWLRGFGLMTIIDHGDGYMSLYGHSSSLLASPGDWVAAGQAIAIAGQSGGTEQPAVYFEIRHKGTPQNPRRWLAPR